MLGMSELLDQQLCREEGRLSKRKRRNTRRQKRWTFLNPSMPVPDQEIESEEQPVASQGTGVEEIIDHALPGALSVGSERQETELDEARSNAVTAEQAGPSHAAGMGFSEQETFDGSIEQGVMSHPLMAASDITAAEESMQMY